MKFYNLTKNEVLKELNTTEYGLKSNEAQIRLEKDGKNELPSVKPKSVFKKFFMQFKDFMIIVLLMSALISFILSFYSEEGDLIDSLIIIGIVVFNAIIGVMQEQKAENALNELKKMSQSYAKVIRDNQIKNIPVQELVVGDKVIINAGDIIPADLYITEAFTLSINEANLTGESHAVEKKVIESLDPETPLGDRLNLAFSSSIVQKGRGVGFVVAVGLNTELGKIATLINNTKEEVTPLQKNLSDLGKVITICILIIATFIFFLDIFLTNAGVLNSFMTAIAIAVAAIPESLPAVVTIIMAIGVLKMSKKNAIVKRLHAVETLGACEIICTDKTGTLTQNKMQVKQSVIGIETINLKEKEIFNLDQEEYIRCLALCNDSMWTGNKALGDSTETALTEFIEFLGIKTENIKIKYPRVSEIPFDSDRKLMSTIHPQANDFVVYTKGAPDSILNRCTKILINGEIILINDYYKDVLNRQIDKMGEEALRVLAFAKKNIAFQSEPNIENDLIFLGLVGIADPVRPLVKSAVIKCKKAGMTPIMITGDHLKTAYAVAVEIGICRSQDEVLLGSDLDKLSEEDFLQIIKKIKVYARVSPQNKVRIVQAWKSLGKVVAMTGDGVNDAPSLKQAHIGIGMGITGTDVTKDVADLILADDNFVTIVLAVEEGRKIFANIQKTIQFLFSTNITEVVALTLATILFPQNTFLFAIQILYINLITDTLPAIALGLEPVEEDIMNKPPRKLDDSIFSNGVGKAIILQGTAQVIICMAIYIIATFCFDAVYANTMAFLCINFMQLFHMFNVKSHHSIFKTNPLSNKLFLVAFFAGIMLTLIIALIPALAIAFNLVNLSITQWAIVLGFAFIIIPFVELIKFVDNHITAHEDM